MGLYEREGLIPEPPRRRKRNRRDRKNNHSGFHYGTSEG